MSFFGGIKIILGNVAGYERGEHPFPGSSIFNFGMVEQGKIYRGSEPKRELDYAKLKQIYNIKTVIDLTEDGAKQNMIASCKSMGITYKHIPLDGHSYPQESEVTQILATLEDKSLYPLYLHCESAIHRTGSMIAIFRMKDCGWDYQRAYKEMLSYGFYTEFRHAAFKQIVIDYAKRYGK